MKLIIYSIECSIPNLPITQSNYNFRDKKVCWVDRWMDEWVDGWVQGLKAVIRIANSNKKQKGEKNKICAEDKRRSVLTYEQEKINLNLIPL